MLYGCMQYTLVANYTPSDHHRSYTERVSRFSNMEWVVAVLHKYTYIPIEIFHMSELGIPHISHAHISHIFSRLHYYTTCNFQYT